MHVNALRSPRGSPFALAPPAPLVRAARSLPFPPAPRTALTPPVLIELSMARPGAAVQRGRADPGRAMGRGAGMGRARAQPPPVGCRSSPAVGWRVGSPRMRGRQRAPAWS